MPLEPETKRVIAFIDGQNLYFSAREAFGYTYPNYDPLALARRVCTEHNWALMSVNFYTGVPDQNANPRWHAFWEKKLALLGKCGVKVYSRPLRYRNETILLSDGKETTVLVGQEKGIDVRIAIDVIRCCINGDFDVALIFSQDQDLSEVAAEIRKIAHDQQRWIKIASAFPSSPTSRNTRGIDRTDWIRIDRTTYDSCLDTNDYREKEKLDV